MQGKPTVGLGLGNEEPASDGKGGKAQYKIVVRRPQHVKAACLCCADEKSKRYELLGVHISRSDKGGLYIVASNGHILSIGYDREGEIEGPDSVLIRIPNDFYRKIKDSHDKLVISGKLATIDTGYDVIGCYVDPMDSTTFPDWKRFVPRPNAASAFGAFNTGYLALLDRIKKCYYPGSDRRAIWIVGNGQEDPHILRLTDVDDWIGVLMPMMRETFSMPDWLPDIPKEDTQ